MMKERDINTAPHNHKLTWNYDVFLCFRGEDTQYTFTGNLYKALWKKKIKTFVNHDGRKNGDYVSFILKTLEESRVTIVVFSKGFASSMFCLDEVVKILECKKNYSQLVLPIFYDVDPSDVSCESGGSSYQMAFTKLQQQRGKFPNNLEKIQKWKSALSSIAPATGSYEDWQLQKRDKYKYEYERIDKIVKWVTSTLRRSNVFLSFWGNDSYSLVGFLQNALEKEKFKIHMHDEKSEELDQFSPSLVKAIQKSCLSIIVLSENYAYSSLCLDELATIFDCREKKKQAVCPIFYKVEASDIRLQINSFGGAMAKHENMFGRDSEKVQKWRSVLRQVASLHEIDSDKEEHVRIISSIVKRVATDVSLSEKVYIQSEENQQKPRWRHDVFLSFKGNDTRECYTGYLYHALHHKRFKAFADEEAKVEKDGNFDLMTKLGNAIEESRILIVVLSKNYAFSPDCLRVLTMILDSKKKNNQLVIPIFYGVHPSDLRKHSHGAAMNALEEDYGKEEVKKWSSALREVVDLRDDDDDHKIGEDQRDHHITNIVKEVSNALPCYDVFLSLSGKDNLCFTDFLRKALDAKGFEIFPKDKGSKDGDQTSIPINVTAIEKSRLSIIIFSENYVLSPSCLDELVAIMNCMEKDRQLVWPIFYKVEPSDIRHQTNSFEKAMIEHESKSGHDKVKEWKSAMTKAANLKGWHLKIGDEYEIIDEIVKKAIEI